MDETLEDCYYFLYSNCKRGDMCKYRHNVISKQNPILCEGWDRNGKCRHSCPFRHSHYHLNRERNNDECYWETQPGGCRKEFCEFKHKHPKKDSWKSNDLKTNIQVQMEKTTAEKSSSKKSINKRNINRNGENIDSIDKDTADAFKYKFPDTKYIINQSNTDDRYEKDISNNVTSRKMKIREENWDDGKYEKANESYYSDIESSNSIKNRRQKDINESNISCKENCKKIKLEDSIKNLDLNRYINYLDELLEDSFGADISP